MIIVGNIFAGLSGGGGSAVVTGNGLSGDGSAGNPVILGGTLTAAFTEIDAGATDFIIAGSSGDFGVDFLLEPNAIQLNFVNSVTHNDALVAVQNDGPDDAEFVLSAGVPGTIKEIKASSKQDGTGIVITDTVDLEGLVGDQDFTDPANPLQYLQRVGAVSKSAGFSGESLTANTQLSNFGTDAAGAAAYRVSAALYAAIVAGSAKISIHYTGFDNVARTLDMAVAIVATGDAPNPSLTLLCAPATFIQVFLIITGTVNCQVTGALELVNNLS